MADLRIDLAIYPGSPCAKQPKREGTSPDVLHYDWEAYPPRESRKLDSGPGAEVSSLARDWAAHWAALQLCKRLAMACQPARDS